VALLKSADHELQKQAARVLWQLTYLEEQNIDAIISAGVLFAWHMNACYQ
jgi:hypothetical protein